MRSVSINGSAIELNHKPVFQRLVLDQQYFPDGIYTAKDDETLIRDIELSKAAGFNGARMHMKVFEPRYIYHADKLGYLLWGEFPNWGLDEKDPASPSLHRSRMAHRNRQRLQPSVHHRLVPLQRNKRKTQQGRSQNSLQPHTHS